MHDELITKAGVSVSPNEVASLLKDVYEVFPQVIEDLSNRNDFPLEEGDSGNLWNHIAEYCYRASLIDSTFVYLRLIAYEEWYKAMIKFDSDKNSRTIHKGMPLHQLGIFHLQSGKNN